MKKSAGARMVWTRPKVIVNLVEFPYHSGQYVLTIPRRNMMDRHSVRCRISFIVALAIILKKS